MDEDIGCMNCRWHEVAEWMNPSSMYDPYQEEELCTNPKRREKAEAIFAIWSDGKKKKLVKKFGPQVNDIVANPGQTDQDELKYDQAWDEIGTELEADKDFMDLTYAEPEDLTRTPADEPVGEGSGMDCPFWEYDPTAIEASIKGPELVRIIREATLEVLSALTEELQEYRNRLHLEPSNGPYSLGRNEANVSVGRAYIFDVLDSCELQARKFIDALPQGKFESPLERFYRDPKAYEAFRKAIKREIAPLLTELYTQLRKSDINWLIGQVAGEITDRYHEAAGDTMDYFDEEQRDIQEMVASAMLSKLAEINSVLEMLRPKDKAGSTTKEMIDKAILFHEITKVGGDHDNSRDDTNE